MDSSTRAVSIKALANKSFIASLAAILSEKHTNKYPVRYIRRVVFGKFDFTDIEIRTALPPYLDGSSIHSIDTLRYIYFCRETGNVIDFFLHHDDDGSGNVATYVSGTVSHHPGISKCAGIFRDIYCDPMTGYSKKRKITHDQLLLEELKDPNALDNISRVWLGVTGSTLYCDHLNVNVKDTSVTFHLVADLEGPVVNIVVPPPPSGESHDWRTKVLNILWKGSIDTSIGLVENELCEQTLRTYSPDTEITSERKTIHHLALLLQEDEDDWTKARKMIRYLLVAMNE